MGKLVRFPGRAAAQSRSVAITAPAPKCNLVVGTRIYYGGDMANPDGFGVIAERKGADKYSGAQVHITMDDGREMWIYEVMFSPEYKGHGGTRFVTETAYDAYREDQIAAFRQRFPKLT